MGWRGHFHDGSSCGADVLMLHQAVGKAASLKLRKVMFLQTASTTTLSIKANCPAALQGRATAASAKNIYGP